MQTLEERYPELRGKRDELLAAIKAELSPDSDSEGNDEYSAQWESHNQEETDETEYPGTLSLETAER